MQSRTDLLDKAIEAHGGLALWQSVGEVRAKLSGGGFGFAAKFQGRALHRAVRGGVAAGDDGEVRVSTTTPRTILAPYPGPGRRGVFEADLVRIESEDGRVLAERRNPRAAFGDFRHNLWWDPLDLLYFRGYALWNYLTAPFLLLRPGIEYQEVPPWDEKGERWRRLAVTFPPDLPTHSREQVFYFDAAGLLRRLDYTAEPFGSYAKSANYAWQHQTFSGLVVPTRRDVLLRKSTGRPRPWPTLVWIKLDQVTLG
jgi:hypothetical protein